MNNSYYSITVYAKTNGYLVIAKYKVADKNGYRGYSTEEDEFVFTEWQEVRDFFKANQLVVPPVDVHAER